MQPVSRNPFRARARRVLLEADHDPARLRESPSADRDVPPPARDTCGAWPGVSPYRPPPRADRTFRTAQTGGSIPFRPHIPPRTDRMFHPLSAGDAPHGRPLSTQGQAQKTGRQPTLYAEAGTKKTGRQPTLGPARGTGYRDASSCRRPAICGKISAQITRRTGTARQPGQPVVQI